MKISFDPEKDAGNIRKHGISLKRAEDFDFDTAHYKPDQSQDYGEHRMNALGWLDAGLWHLTFTQRPTSIRPISLRRATKQEHKDYAEAF